MRGRRRQGADAMCILLDSIADLCSLFRFEARPILVEDDLDEVWGPEDVNRRRRLDAEVLSTIAANVPAGRMLDIGTGEGRSALRMAVNSPDSSVYTVNLDPDSTAGAGRLITGVPSRDTIGHLYRERGLSNVTQIFANTRTWLVPPEIDGLSLAYVDGCHDRGFVEHDTRLALRRLLPGGFLLWHDFTPLSRLNFEWIDEVMSGVDRVARRGLLGGFIYTVRSSWIGIWRRG